jgi:acid phosphatase (class A)
MTSEGSQERFGGKGRAWRERRYARQGVGVSVGVFACGAVLGAAAGSAIAPKPTPVRSGFIGAGVGAPSSAAPADADLDAGYIPAHGLDGTRFLPPPPTEGPRAEADRRIFQDTRALKDTPRWALARNDADQTSAATLKDFSCAVGIALTPASVPLAFGLLERFVRDQAPVLEPAKARYNRPRPFVAAKGDICVARTDDLARNPDYPSGHAAWAWAVALILGEAAPERRDLILARGRAYGESRVVCGVHTASAIEAGQMLGAAMVSAAQASSSFRNDVQEVAAELAAARRSAPAPDPAQCAAEQALTATSAY